MIDTLERKTPARAAPDNNRATVYIVDDDAAVRDSLALLLGLHGYATRPFESGRAFLEHVDGHAYGCALVDLKMPEIDGLAVQRELLARAVGLPIVVITAHGDVPAARTALRAGAVDFIEKPIDEGQLLEAIESAVARSMQAEARAGRSAELRQRLARLTERERQVLDRVVAGRHNREIAAELAISARTVEVYKARLMDKLQVRRVPEIVRLVMEANEGGPGANSQASADGSAQPG